MSTHDCIWIFAYHFAQNMLALILAMACSCVIVMGVLMAVDLVEWIAAAFDGDDQDPWRMA